MHSLSRCLILCLFRLSVFASLHSSRCGIPYRLRFFPSRVAAYPCIMRWCSLSMLCSPSSMFSSCHAFRLCSHIGSCRMNRYLLSYDEFSRTLCRSADPKPPKPTPPAPKPAPVLPPAPKPAPPTPKLSTESLKSHGFGHGRDVLFSCHGRSLRAPI